MPGTQRRTLLGRAAAIGAGTAAAGLGGAVLTAAPAQAAAGTASTASLVSADPLLHLLRRATYGPTPAAVAEIRELGAAAWLGRQLTPAAIADGACDTVLGRLEYLHLDIAGVRAASAAGKFKRGGYDAMQQVGYAALARAAWSQRQLYEVMVDFWANHLNVTCPFGEAWDSRPHYDRAVIRKHALGRFADMLKASARHPAMLAYLDNRVSTKTKPNENYGRELLELHTVGLIHTEADVQNAARLLTGLTVDKATGLYRYDATRHATGTVKVLGFTHANATAAGGAPASLALLDYLALHPATARRIATKLCVRFVADEPPAGLVDRLTAVYLAGKSAIAPVLRALFDSPEFAASVGAKIRTPLEDLMATVRALGLGPEPADTGVTGLRALYWMADGVGHAPLRWSPPNGYPDVAAAWASPAGQLGRWNSHLNLAAGWWAKQLTRPGSMARHLVPTLPATYGALVDALTMRLLGTVVTDAHRAALTGFFGRQPGATLKPTDGAANGGFPYLVALVLDSPYFSVR
jgi:uncharacterized protein (DUF1800 family)